MGVLTAALRIGAKSRSSPIAALWTLTIGEFIVLAALAVARTTFWSYGSDTGTFAQIVGDAFGGMRDGLEAGSHFRYHWSPALAALWPFVAIGHGVLALQVFQAAATVAAAPLLYAIARPYVTERLAYRTGLLTLLYPPLLAVGFDEFHELGLLTPLVLGMFLAADRSRWGWFALCALAAIGLREDVCLELVVLGIAFALIGLRPASDGSGLLDGAPRAPRMLAAAGVALAVAAAGALALYAFVILPHLGSWRPRHFYTYPFASGPLGVVAASLLHPRTVAAAVLTAGRLTYVLEALVPLAMLPLLSRWALLVVPGAAIVLFANSAMVWRMGNHYAALWIPWLLVAAAAGVAVVMRRYGQRVALQWTSAALCACALFLVAFNPMHPVHFLRPSYHDLASVRRALECVPLAASMATHDEWFSQIAAQRPNATIDRSSGVDYLVYADDFPNEQYQRQLRPLVAEQVLDGRYRAICRFGAVAVYRRVGSVTENR
ncbi:MAG: DUF2079 domain-containing protein [Vulcanimicrobiaceae bacterium]